MTKKESLEEVLKQLRARVAKIPKKSGIYRWLDGEGTILYVGKAKDLRNRLKSYVQKRDTSLGPWKLALLDRIADFDYTVTKNELEALILETNLIKEHRPKYNVLMKDDKNYVYLQIAAQDPYPTLEILRQMEEPRERTSTVLSTGSALLRGGSPRVKRPNGRHAALYFGPFLSGHDLRSTLDLLHLVFAYRACQRSIDLLNKGKPSQLKPCIEQQIGRCNGLCAGTITQEGYRNRIGKVIQFFRGHHEEALQRLQTLMQEAAEAKQFEKAAKLRDTLQYIHSLQEQQIVSGTSGADTDIFGIALLRGRAQVVLLKERDGKVVQEIGFALRGEAENSAEILEQFLPQYYSDTLDIPDTILIGESFEGQKVLGEWLNEKRKTNKRITIHIPERGKKSKLLAMAEANALEKVEQQFARWEAEEARVERALQELQTALALPKLPERIECYDISHLGGTETVGSMVVFFDGKAATDHYRSFTIRTMHRGEIDDYKALREVLLRRLRHLTEGRKDWLKQISIALEKKGKLYVIIHHALESTYAERGFRYVQTFPGELKEKMEKDMIVMMLEKKTNKPDQSLTTHPDLLVLDGGKGQLGIGIEVVKRMHLDIPVISLAKREEEVFVPGKELASPIPEEARYLLMRLRDEAHRFANRHRERRAKHALIS